MALPDRFFNDFLVAFKNCFDPSVSEVSHPAFQPEIQREILGKPPVENTLHSPIDIDMGPGLLHTKKLYHNEYPLF